MLLHMPPFLALLTAIVPRCSQAYSLSGENAHYGAPTNPAAPGRVTGGSSSGTAAAVAAGDADIGLGASESGVDLMWAG